MANKHAPSNAKRRKAARGTARSVARPRPKGSGDGGETVPLLEERILHPEASPILSGGDLDADWMGALGSGEEGVGGSSPTPDQDIVDEIGRALGVEQPADAEVRTSDEILRFRHRLYWHLERDAAAQEEA